MKKTLIVLSDAILLSVFKSWVFRSQKKDSLFLAKNGKEAIDIMQSNTIDLLVTELNLAEVDGLELLADFSFYYPSLKVSVLTPVLPEHIAKRLVQLNSFHFLKKPDTLKDFTNLIALLDVADFQAKSLEEMVISDFFELIEIQKKTCLLTLETEKNYEKGMVYFAQGILYDATSKDLKAELAIIEMLSWKQVKITFKNLDNKKFRKQIQTSLATLIVETAKAKTEIETEIQSVKTQKIVDPAIAKAEAEAKAKAEKEAKVKLEAEAKAKAEQDAKAQLQAETKAKAEAEAKAKAEKEAKVKLEAETKAKAEAAEKLKKAESEAKAEKEAEAKKKAKAMAVRLAKLDLAGMLKPLQEANDYLAAAIFDMTGEVLVKHNNSEYNVEDIGENALTLVRSAVETMGNIGLGTCNFIQINCESSIFEGIWVLEDQFIVAILLKPTATNTVLAKMRLTKVCEAIHCQLSQSV